MSNSAGSLRSVERAISVLEVLAARGEAGVTEVASEIAVHKSTAFRLLGALEGGGLVEQTGHRGKYRLGFGLIPLAGAVSDRLDVVQQGRAVCTRLATELGETVNVAVLRDHFAVNVDQARGPSRWPRTTGSGSSPRCTARRAGRCCWPTWIRRRAPTCSSGPGHLRLTPRTETAAARLEEQLARVRETGYATAVEEYEVGLNAVAAPVFDRSGQVIAAVSVSGPSYRLDEQRIRHWSPRCWPAPPRSAGGWGTGRYGPVTRPDRLLAARARGGVADHHRLQRQADLLGRRSAAARSRRSGAGRARPRGGSGRSSRRAARGSGRGRARRRPSGANDARGSR